MGQKGSKREPAPSPPLSPPPPSPRSHQRSLVSACKEGDVDAVRCLLQAGGLEVRNAQGTVLPCRTGPYPDFYYQRIELVNFSLTKAGEDVAAIQEARAMHGERVAHVTAFRTLVTLLCLKDQSVDARDFSGCTSLHVACYYCDEYMAVLLLQAGASLDVKDNNGERPFHTAIGKFFRRGRFGSAIAIIQDLIQHGDAWDALCDDAVACKYGDYREPYDDDERRLWLRVGPALRFVVLFWMDERRLGLPLSNIPIEEIERGLEAVQAFAKALRASDQIVCRRTICVVGPSTAGKTSLIKSLIEKGVRLESSADRTVGIDHFTLQFVEPTRTRVAQPRLHQVRFSDFAGQDVYQIMHSLFFTSRTLFLIAVDLNAYSIALLKCEMLTQDDAKLQHMMNEYVDRTVLSWIRIVLARQPDAQFVFICTKADTVASGPCVDKREVMDHVKTMLRRVMVIVQDVKPQTERRHGGGRKDDERNTTSITYLWDPRLQKGCNSTVVIIETTATTATSVQQTRRAIEALIIQNGKGYDTPELYMLVLDALLRRKEAAEKLPIYRRIQATFVDVDELIEELRPEFSGLTEKIAKDILRTLRDCVDILWYEDLDDEKLQSTVILDPRLIIEFVRQVINHNHASATISHAILSGLPYWKDLNGDRDSILSMKRLLQTFRLVHPASGDMAFDSDLIVPAYWKTKQPALWKFGGDHLRLNPRGLEDETYARRVHWELRFTHFIPDTLFDHLNIACYSPDQLLEAGPDWMLYRNGELAACRVVVSRHWKTHERSLQIEAVLADEDRAGVLWRIFTRVCKALASVLKEHPGLVVTRFAHTATKDYQPSLASILQAINDDVMDDQTWMPPEPVASECIKALVGK